MQWYFCLSWEATLVLSIWRVRVRKLYWQGATTVLPICACYLAHLSPDFCSKYGCTRITTVGQSPATMVQNGLQQSLCIAEKWSSEVVPVFPKRSRFELGKIRFFSLLIWRFMASGILLQFDTSHHAVVVLLVLEATLVLTIRTGASVEVVKTRCQIFSSTVCMLFGLFEPRSLWQCRSR